MKVLSIVVLSIIFGSLFAVVSYFSWLRWDLWWSGPAIIVLACLLAAGIAWSLKTLLGVK